MSFTTGTDAYGKGVGRYSNALAEAFCNAVAACVWGYAGEMTMLRVFWDAALELDPNAPDEGAVMRHCTPPELAALWSDAWLREVVTGELVVHGDYADFDDYCRRSPRDSPRPGPTAFRSTRGGGKRCARRASDASAHRRAPSV